LKSPPELELGQEGQQLPFMVPLWLFSVQNESSLREPTALDLSRQILQQFACDGFLTAGNPVMIRIQAGLENFQIGWEVGSSPKRMFPNEKTHQSPIPLALPRMTP